MSAAAKNLVDGFDPSVLTRAESKALFAALPEPKSLFGYLLMCLETPRPSEDLQRMRDKITAIGKAHGFEIATDKVGNIRLRKAASDQKYANAPRVCIQSHMDVVTTATDPKHDFHTQPVDAYIDGDWLKAKGTTLGADDGIGVAAGLAMLTRPGLKHGPLEAVFTADEETTMAGAEFMEQFPFLNSNVLINVDSEEEHSICVGCAGGFEQHLKLPMKRVAAADFKADDYTPLTISIDKLLGGHSGININDGRANGLQVLARLIQFAAQAVGAGDAVLLQSYKGGNAANAIPHEASATLFVRNTVLTSFKTSVNNHWASLLEEFKIVEQPLEKDGDKHGGSGGAKSASGPVVLKPLAWTIEIKDGVAAAKDVPCDAATTQRAIDLIVSAPHGVLRMSAAVKGEPDTSVNLAYATLNSAPAAIGAKNPADAKRGEAQADLLVLHFFARSSFDSQMIETNRKLNALARLSGCLTADRFNYFPGWQPDITSVALQHTRAAHAALFPNVTPKVYAVHAGLECGLIQGRYPNIDCVSIGPTIHGAHTPDERLKISSAKPFYDWLSRTIENLAEAQSPATAAGSKK